jgi:hypothetical protein
MSLYIINPSKIFNIYNLENTIPYTWHTLIILFLWKRTNAHATRVNATMFNY